MVSSVCFVRIRQTTRGCWKSAALWWQSCKKQSVVEAFSTAPTSSRSPKGSQRRGTTAPGAGSMMLWCIAGACLQLLVKHCDSCRFEVNKLDWACWECGTRCLQNLSSLSWSSGSAIFESRSLVIQTFSEQRSGNQNPELLCKRPQIPANRDHKPLIEIRLQGC